MKRNGEILISPNAVIFLHRKKIYIANKEIEELCSEQL
jgi:hypothetical protein